MTTDLILDGIPLSSAVPDAALLRPTRFLVGRRRFASKDVPGRAGPWIFSEQPGAGSVEADLHILSGTFAERRAACSALADWCDLVDPAPLIVGDLPDRYYEAILENTPSPQEWLTASELTLVFQTGPYQLAVATSTANIVATPPSDSGDFTIPDGVAAEPIIEVTATGGTIETFNLTINGDQLVYLGPAIPSGDTITISSISDTVTAGVNGDTMLTGAYSGTNLIANVYGTFPDLVAGVNTWAINYTGTATSAAVDITWRRRYR